MNDMPANRNLLVVAVIIIVAELLMILFVIDASRKKLIEGLITQGIQKQRIASAQVAKTLEEDHQGIHDRLSLLAQHPSILIGSPAQCQVELAKAARFMESRVDNLIRTDKQGNIDCAQNKEAVGINVFGDEDFKTLFANPGTRETHAHIMHRVTFSSVSKQYVVGMHMARFSDEGEFLGSLGGAIYISKLGEKYFQDFEGAERSRVSLVDDNGDLLFSANPKAKEVIGKNLLAEEVLKLIPAESSKEKYITLVKELLAEVREGRTGISRYYNLPEPESISVYYPVKVLPNRYWAVAMRVPIQEITEEADQSSLIAGIKGFSALFIATIAIVLITQISLFIYLTRHLSVYHGAKDDQ